MFDLAKSSSFFEQMEKDHPTIVQNIEIVYDNCRALDETYHRPKQFILSLNNLLRSLLFFMELSVKNSPQWLHDAVVEFRTTQRRDYEILRELRNLSVHQKLIFPKESLAVGLFRIRSSKHYIFKLGLGDLKGPGSFASAFALQDTEELFDDLLVFSSLAFMDLEHSALNECLGVTRRWFYRPKAKKGEEEIGTIDLYRLISNFSNALLDYVCERYAIEKGMKCERKFIREMDDYNCINTLLEIDLYPSLFKKWWESDGYEPLNYGIRMALSAGRKCVASNEWYSIVYEDLTDTPEAYRAALERYIVISAKDLMQEVHLVDFMSFISVNHWHFKRAYPNSFMKSAVKPHEIMRLQRIGKLFFEAVRQKDDAKLERVKAILNEELRSVADALDDKRPAEASAKAEDLQNEASAPSEGASARPE